MRYELRPLGAWTDPVTSPRRPSMFKATWSDTLKLLDRETSLLGATLVVIQIDVTEGDIRRDGMLRANARVGHPGVVVSFDSKYGPLRYATDAYEHNVHRYLTGWQANCRAIGLAMEALRAVDRYGVSNRGEQYVGWKALPAGSGVGFATADAALDWMRAKARPHMQDSGDARELYRFLARRYHPDVGGAPEDWERLDQARQLLDLGGDRG
jgi:hypothetical protein